MAGESDATTRQQVLDLIVEEGPVTASSVAKILELATAAMRCHTTLLPGFKEIVEYEPSAPSKHDRGRPARHYAATEWAYVHLADGYSDLASKAFRYLGQLGGHEAVESFAAARSREIKRYYAPIVRDAGSDPWVHARTLTDTLAQGSYVATVRDIGGGALAVQLCQGHCSIQNVAGGFPQLYDAEMLAFGRLLDVHVQRLPTLVGGGHVCTIRIPVGVPVIRPEARNVQRRQRLVKNGRLTQQ